MATKLSSEMKSRLQERVQSITTDPFLTKVYMAEVMRQLEELDVTDEELTLALSINLLDLRGSLEKIAKGYGNKQLCHPLRFASSSRPVAKRDETGKLVWIKPMNLVRMEITLDDVRAYAKSHLQGIPDNGGNQDGIFDRLQNEAQNLIQRRRSQAAKDHPIHSLEALDLILFAIDAADFASRSSEPLRSYFNIQNYFNDGINMYYDKCNA